MMNIDFWGFSPGIMGLENDEPLIELVKLDTRVLLFHRACDLIRERGGWVEFQQER